jgi:pimeloyl-ACP methyl ester carboxylesterase
VIEQIEPSNRRVVIAGEFGLRALLWGPVRGPEDAASRGGVSSGGASRGAPSREAPSGDAAPSGEAAPWLLVHGLASNARLWDGVARRLAEAGSTAVAVDLRGHGRSDKPDGGYDFATIAEDLRGLIGALGLDRPILAGQSWGANVVLDFAVRHPELTRGIVLVDGGLTDLGAAFPTWDVCWDRLAPPPLVGMPLSDVEGYFLQNHADWPKEGLEGSLANFEVRPDRTIAPWLSKERHKAILEAMWGQRTGELWSRLRVPALIVPVDGGESDWTRAKRAGADAAEAALRASGVPGRVEWFRGDHDIHAQHPAELTETMLDAARTGLFAGVPEP